MRRRGLHEAAAAPARIAASETSRAFETAGGYERALRAGHGGAEYRLAGPVAETISIHLRSNGSLAAARTWGRRQTFHSPALEGFEANPDGVFSRSERPPRRSRILIGLFVRHPVAPNLLMALMILVGVVALGDLNRQFFPDVDRSLVSIGVDWSGVGAEDVASRITLPIHEELRTLDGLERVASTTSDGRTAIRLKFLEGTDMDEAVDEIKDRLDAMRSLPETADEPVIAKQRVYETVALLLLTGPEDRQELRRLAREIEGGLLEAGIDRVEVRGDREEEVAIQVSGATLRDLRLSLDEIAARVGRHSRDMPAGTVGRDDFATRLRALGQRRREVDFEQIPVFGDERGRRLELGDIASVERRPRPGQVEVLYDGRPALVFDLKRSTSGDMLEAGAALSRWRERVALPPGVELHVFNEGWSVVWARIMLLVRNGGGGLALVLVILFVFLNARVAFWVAVGIPVSFMAALGALWAAGGSINMISLFAFIMTVGIIVDDAIVVGEDGLTHHERGAEPADAAERGARRMFVPVMSSSMTTIAAFVPLMVVTGFVGQIMFQIPLVVICVIAASLVESFLILPGHLRRSFTVRHRPGRVRGAVEAGIERFRERVFRPAVRRAVAAPAVVVALGFALLLVAAGLVRGGHLKFHFFPTPEINFIYADIRFTAGTPRERVREFALEVERALREAEEALDEDFVDLAYVQIGSNVAGAGAGGSASADSAASVSVELLDSDRRRNRNAPIMQAWESRVAVVPGLESFVIAEAAVGPPGSDVDTRLTGADSTVLKAAAEEVAAGLAALPGTLSVADNMPYGQRQLIFELTAEGEALGLTVAEVGRQLRTAYDGSLAQIFQDGDDEIEVRVMLPDDERNRLASLGSLGIVAPSGETVPLDAVVNLRTRRGFDTLLHADGRLAVNVTASIDPRATSAGEVNEVVLGEILPVAARRHGVGYSTEGRSRTQSRTLDELRTGLVVALVLIYLVLAWVFGSYFLPFTVMSAIPFGLVGVLAGHWVMGVDVSVLSIFGFFALSGIVVNDSIILVTFYRELRERMPAAGGAGRRGGDRRSGLPAPARGAPDQPHHHRGPDPAHVRDVAASPVPDPDGDHHLLRARLLDPDRAVPRTRPARVPRMGRGLAGAAFRAPAFRYRNHSDSAGT